MRKLANPRMLVFAKPSLRVQLDVDGFAPSRLPGPVCRAQLSPISGRSQGPELVACERCEDAQTEDEQQADDPSDHNAQSVQSGMETEAAAYTALFASNADGESLRLLG